MRRRVVESLGSAVGVGLIVSAGYLFLAGLIPALGGLAMLMGGAAVLLEIEEADRGEA